MTNNKRTDMRFDIKPRIFIRADGSSEIGLGHIMRTGALAAELCRRGADVVYITRYPQYIKDYPAVNLPPELDIADEPAWIADLLAKKRGPADSSPKAKSSSSAGEGLSGGDAVILPTAGMGGGMGLIIDHYGFDQAGLDRWAALSHLTNMPEPPERFESTEPPELLDATDPPYGPGIISLIIDDMNLYAYNSTLVLNQNAYAPELTIKGSARALLGASYLLLRREFADLPAREARTRVSDVLITMGAADPLRLTLKIMEMLTDYSGLNECRWHVIIGPAFAHAAGIQDLAASQPAFVVHVNPPEVKEIMLLCDISISAAGSSTYELAACGVPSLLVVAADNQRLLAERAAVMGWSRNLGEGRDLEREALWKALDELISDGPEREKMARLGQAAIDGQGAARVAEELLGLIRRR